MNTKDLDTFLAVAETRSFSEAAQVLNITQPAVTKRIQAFEQNLDATLFDRVGKRVHLTAAGEVMLHEARTLIGSWSDTQRKIANISSNVSGPLKLATSHHIGLHRLAPVLQAYRATYSDVALNITFEDSEVAHEMLTLGEIELAVVTLNPEGAGNLSYTPVWHDPLRFVTAPGTRTAKRLSLNDLANLPCVLPGTATFTGRIVLDRFAAAGIDLKPAMSTNYLETLSMLVRVGLGWSVLPESMAGDLKILNVDCPEMSRTLGCVTHPARALSNAARAFYEVVVEPS